MVYDYYRYLVKYIIDAHKGMDISNYIVVMWWSNQNIPFYHVVHLVAYTKSCSAHSENSTSQVMREGRSCVPLFALCGMKGINIHLDLDYSCALRPNKDNVHHEGHPPETCH